MLKTNSNISRGRTNSFYRLSSCLIESATNAFNNQFALLELISPLFFPSVCNKCQRLLERSNVSSKIFSLPSGTTHHPVLVASWHLFEKTPVNTREEPHVDHSTVRHQTWIFWRGRKGRICVNIMNLVENVIGPFHFYLTESIGFH